MIYKDAFVDINAVVAQKESLTKTIIGLESLMEKLNSTPRRFENDLEGHYFDVAKSEISKTVKDIQIALNAANKLKQDLVTIEGFLREYLQCRYIG